MISIILPTYNRSSILNQTIDCVLKQSYTDYELIIINDSCITDFFSMCIVCWLEVEHTHDR